MVLLLFCLSLYLIYIIFFFLLYCLFRSVRLQCSVCFQSLSVSPIFVFPNKSFFYFLYFLYFLTSLLFLPPFFMWSIFPHSFQFFVIFIFITSCFSFAIIPFSIFFLFKFPFSLISHFLFQTSPSVFYVRFPYLPYTTKPIFNKICIPLQMDEQEVTNAWEMKVLIMTRVKTKWQRQ